MSIKESKIKHLIREYLIEEGLLRQNLPNKENKLDFGFQFSFPPGPIGVKMVVYKPRNKDLVIISLGTQISKPHVEALKTLSNEKRMRFFMDLRKFFLLKDVFFRIDIQNYRYEITDQIFPRNEGIISKNSFFKSIRKVFTCSAYSNMILADYCMGKVKPEDFAKSKEFTSDFSLYT